MYTDENPFSRASEDAALAWVMSILRINFQQDLSPVSVNFTHNRPVCVGKYYEFFHSPVSFGAPVANISLSLDVVDQVLPAKNDELAELSDHLMVKYIDSLNNIDLITRVKKLLQKTSPLGIPLSTMSHQYSAWEHESCNGCCNKKKLHLSL